MTSITAIMDRVLPRLIYFCLIVRQIREAYGTCKTAKLIRDAIETCTGSGGIETEEDR